MIELGYLPLGSGNDFARGMKISRDYRKELQKILKENKKRKIDYGLVDFPDGRRRRFFVSSGIGYDAKICIESMWDGKIDLSFDRPARADACRDLSGIVGDRWKRSTLWRSFFICFVS